MRGNWLVVFGSILLMMFVTGMGSTQEDITCELDATEIISVIDSICSNTGNNELCYGKNDVTVETRTNAPSVDFNAPGDLMSVDYLQALYLSALNQVADIWGVAQMRLITTTVRGPQEVTLLLYGDVEVDNAVESSTQITIETTASINIRSVPRLTGVVLSSAARGTELQAVGRLEDTSWIRVLIPETSAIGWLSSEFVDIADDNFESLEMLDTMEANDAYFGPMQAFYINTGTNLSCNNVATDGLIIQTPEGTARVTILINEVSIDLIAPVTGTATALVQANSDNGMNISVTSGTAVVSANNSVYNLSSGLTTHIDLSTDLTPSGEFSIPETFSADDLLDLPVLEIVDLPDLNPTIITDSSGNDVTNGSGAPNNATNQENNPSDQSDDVGSSSGDGSGSGSSSGDGSGSGSSSGAGSGDDDGNGNSNGNANGNANGNSNGNSDGD